MVFRNVSRSLIFDDFWPGYLGALSISSLQLIAEAPTQVIGITRDEQAELWDVLQALLLLGYGERPRLNVLLRQEVNYSNATLLTLQFWLYKFKRVLDIV